MHNIFCLEKLVALLKCLSLTSLWRTISLTEATLTLPDFIALQNRRPSLSYARRSDLPYKVIDGKDVLDGADNVLRDQTVIFTKKQDKEKYPGKIRRIVYYAPELCRTFTYYTNNFYFEAKNIALLYKYRWQVELFL